MIMDSKQQKQPPEYKYFKEFNDAYFEELGKILREEMEEILEKRKIDHSWVDKKLGRMDYQKNHKKKP